MMADNSCWMLVTCLWLLVTGHWPLIAGHWLLVTGYWLLDSGCSIFRGAGRKAKGTRQRIRNEQPKTVWVENLHTRYNVFRFLLLPYTLSLGPF